MNALAVAWRLLQTGGVLALDRLSPRRADDLPFGLSQVSAAWLTEALARASPGVSVRSFEWLDRHSGTTARARIRLDYAALGETRLPETLFLKIAPAAPAQRLFVTLARLGLNEVGFYRSVGAGLPVRVPRLYAAQLSKSGARFALLLEDLVASHARFTVVGDRAGLAEARVVMEALARLHAAFWESPRFGGDLAWLPCHENRGRDMAWERVVTGYMLRRVARRFADGMPRDFFRVAELCVSRRQALEALWAQGPHTLVHGDCHIGNLFFEGERVGFFDWQVVSRAPGMRDVSYFLCNSLPGDVRREHERDLIARYLEALGREGAEAPAPEVAWEQHRLFAVYCWVAAAFTAAAGGGLQPPEIGRAALHPATRAVVELGSVALLEGELRS